MTMMKKQLPILMADWYKPSHITMYSKKSEIVQDNMTPRSTKYFTHFVDDDKRIMSAGLQGFIKWFLMDMFNEGFFQRPKDEVIGKFKRVCEKAIGPGMVETWGFEKLHDLGYLPVEIRALPEGTLSPVLVPLFTIQNTHPDFYWLPNYLESVISSETWKTITTATTFWQYRKLAEIWAEKTCDNNLHVPFQNHCFAFRGQAGLHDAAQSEFGQLISSMGTDTIPAILYAEAYYGMEDQFVSGSIPASEHSVATTNIGFIIGRLRSEHPEMSLDDLRFFAEVEFLRTYITEFFPAGFVSYVGDSYDWFRLITQGVRILKDEIMARDGRVVFRPDSGVPEDIICGTLDWRKIEELEEAGTLERAAEWALESAVEEVRQNTPHGERGDDIVERFFLFDGDLYRMSGSIEWNRAEYTYYYTDGSKVTAIDKPELTDEQKGSVELLYDVFGGDLNSKGYRTLDTHVGLIYGDSITVTRAKEIFERLEAKGFASSNIVFGVGSYTTQMVTRDSLGMAVKATGAVIDGQQIMVVKEPKTDLGKKSAQGFLKVVRGEDGELKLVDNLSLEQVNDADNELRPVFRDGKLLVDETLTQIRERVTANLK